MYKRLLLFLTVLLLPVQVLPDSQNVQMTPEQQAALMGDLNMGGGPDNDELLLDAYEVRRGLLCKPEYNKDIIARLDTMITDLQTQEDDETLIAYSYHLRRYKKLSKLCMEENFNEHAYIKLRKLIDEREKIVAQILKHYVKLAFAQKTHTDLEKENSGAESKELKAQYDAEFKQMTDDEFERIKELQEKLTPIEKILLADDRSFGEKYGVLIGVGSIGVVLFGAILLTASLVHGSVKSNKNKGPQKARKNS